MKMLVVLVLVVAGCAATYDPYLPLQVGMTKAQVIERWGHGYDRTSYNSDTHQAQTLWYRWGWARLLPDPSGEWVVTAWGR